MDRQYSKTNGESNIQQRHPKKLTHSQGEKKRENREKKNKNMNQKRREKLSQ